MSCLSPGFLSAQISHGFENYDLANWFESEVTHWEISGINPISGQFSLHHSWDNSTSGHDQISLAIPSLHIDKGNTLWRFKIRHEYPPSSNNNWGVFLLSDKNALEMTPAGNLNAWVVGVNFSGSDDLIKLWKCSGSSVDTVFTTSFNWQEQVPVDSAMAFEITRTKTGVWEVKTGFDFNSLVRIGHGTDTDIITNGYFGLYYEYSSAQDRKLWFDDLLIDGTFIEDSIPPRIKEIQVAGQNQLIVVFSESLQPVSLSDTQSFYVVPEIGYPKSITMPDQDQIRLQFDNPFINENSYKLYAGNLADLSGNIMLPDTFGFFFYMAKPFDVQINEILPDPNPSVGLPEKEFIELKNTSPYRLYMVRWTLHVENKVNEIPTFVMNPGGFLILCSEKDTASFTDFGKVVGIKGFPTLLNDGGNIFISDSNNNIISNVSYNTEWYNDANKAEGGWSLEQVDNASPCLGAINWKASIDFSGGTPGRENSVHNFNPDLDAPSLINTYLEGDSVVRVIFNEPYNRDIAGDPGLFVVDHNIGQPDSIFLIPPDFKEIKLFFIHPFHSMQIYSLVVKPPFADCAGNTIAENNYSSFGISGKTDTLGLVINEVLFHPRPAGVEFVELYNRSLKISDLSQMSIAIRDPLTMELTSVYPLSKTPHLLLPNGYIALTLDPEVLTEQYPVNNPANILKLSRMPNLPASAGTVVLTDKWFEIIDEFTYEEEMHFPLLESTIGVSLERISPEKSSRDPDNWHSAAEDVEFATPGLKNSQYLSGNNLPDPVKVEPEIFSPDNDGYNDVTRLSYHFDEPGYVADIIVFDANGRIIRKLGKNELLGTEGFFAWDGLDDFGRRADIGIYVFFVRVFNLKGRVHAYKKVVVLAAKLR